MSRMAVILKQRFHMVLAALVLVASIPAADAAARGIRGRRQEQFDSLAVSDNGMDTERKLKRNRKKKLKFFQPAVSETVDPVTGRFDAPAAITEAPAPSSPTLSDWIDGCYSQSLDVTACASNTDDFVCKQCLFGLSQTSATPDNASSGLNSCIRTYCETCTIEDLTPFFECGYGINEEFESSIPAPTIRTPPPVNNEINGRLEIPAISTDSAPSTLNTWINGCSSQSLDVTACASNDESVCKQCLYSLSLTSVTISTSNSGVNACARDFCGTCMNEDIKPFFECGYNLTNGIVDTMTPDTSIQTQSPANITDAQSPTNVTDAALVAPVMNTTAIDLVNCPAVYPRNEACIMIEGFEMKKCRYYEVGPDVKCECSLDQPIWSCTGRVTNEDYLEDNFEVVSNDAESEDFVQALPGTNILISRVGGL